MKGRIPQVKDGKTRDIDPEVFRKSNVYKKSLDIIKEHMGAVRNER